MNRRRKFFAFLFFVLIVGALVAACSSSDPYDNPRPMGGRGTGPGGRGGYGGGMAGGPAQGQGGGFDMLPPGTWWHDDEIAKAVNLSSEQVAALDKISGEQADDIAKLIRDTQVAMREVRDALDTDPLRSEDLTAAGQRLRSMRDTTLDKQLKMLAAERGVLSRQQWSALENALQSRRSERQQDRGMYPRGRGGMGGRRPGFPG